MQNIPGAEPDPQPPNLDTRTVNPLLDLVRKQSEHTHLWTSFNPVLFTERCWCPQIRRVPANENSIEFPAVRVIILKSQHLGLSSVFLVSL